MEPTALLALLTSGTPSAIFAAVFIYILNKYISATEKREEWFRLAVKDLTDAMNKMVDRLDRLEARYQEESNRRRT